MPAQIRTPHDVKQLGTILSVWAHPDDESFSAAGIMSAAIANGQTVVCVTATRGEAGVQDARRWPPEKLADIREQEMEAARAVLGLKLHHWLGYHDGHCHEVPPAEGVGHIRELIKTYQPQTILTFGPDGITGHTDHQTVSHWATTAADGENTNVYYLVEEEEKYDNYMKHLDRRHNIYFNIDKPPVYNAADCEIAFKLTPELCRKKCAALKLMPSQTEAMFKSAPEDFMEAALGIECYVKAK